MHIVYRLLLKDTMTALRLNFTPSLTQSVLGVPDNQPDEQDTN